MNKNKTSNVQLFKKFMARVNKLTLGRSTADQIYGSVTLIKSADHRKYNSTYNRTGITSNGHGTRKFSVSNSHLIPNGSYTLTGLRSKLAEAIKL